jgi:hypothetical protein
MNTSVIRGLLVCGMILGVAGCTHYYRVTDPGSGKTYYTTDIHEDRGGAVKLRDERTMSTVTLFFGGQRNFRRRVRSGSEGYGPDRDTAACGTATGCDTAAGDNSADEMKKREQPG